MNRREWLSPLLSMLIAAGLVQACGSESDDNGPVLTADDRRDCEDFCIAATNCDEEVDQAECADECVNALGLCFESQIDDATAELRECVGADECIEVVNCGFEVGAECFFGV